MSTQLPTDSDLRDYAESREAVIVSASQNTDKHLHLPNSDKSEPLCDAGYGCNWMTKHPSVYPKNWLPWCTNCRERLGEIER